MIIWTKQKDGSWSYDYSVFDRWVELMMKLGVHKQINCYSMLPWNYELHYFDETKGEWTTVQAKPGEKMFGQIWTPFLKDFTAHLKSKGWEKITNIAMDERAPEEMMALLNYLKRTAPDMGVALADNHKSYKQFPMLKDVCVYIGSRFDEKDVAFRRKNNLVSTYYVCCGPAFPNTFTFSPPSESAYIGWHAVAAGFDGFLRWAYNSWDKDPMTDSRNHKFPSGDTYLIYLGGRSSIRFERLREGIQDAEKIRILREHLSLSPDAEAPAKLAKLNETVAIFSHAEWMENYTGILNNAKKVVEELSRKH
jgi:hypothetical protein